MCTRYRTCTSHSLMRSLTSQISPCFRGSLEYKKGLINKSLVNIWIKAFMKVLMHGIKITLPATTVLTMTTFGFLELKWKSSSNQMMKAANIHTSKCQAQLPSKLEGKCPWWETRIWRKLRLQNFNNKYLKIGYCLTQETTIIHKHQLLQTG